MIKNMIDIWDYYVGIMRAGVSRQESRYVFPYFPSLVGPSKIGYHHPGGIMEALFLHFSYELDWEDGESGFLISF